MPIVKDAKHVCINVGEVEEIVQIVAPQGLQDPEELVGKVSSLLWRCIVKFLQWSGAGADQESTTGAQVLGQWPALCPREDLPSRKEQALDTESNLTEAACFYLSFTAHTNNLTASLDLFVYLLEHGKAPALPPLLQYIANGRTQEEHCSHWCSGSHFPSFSKWDLRILANLQ